MPSAVYLCLWWFSTIFTLRRGPAPRDIARLPCPCLVCVVVPGYGQCGLTFVAVTTRSLWLLFCWLMSCSVWCEERCGRPICFVDGGSLAAQAPSRACPGELSVRGDTARDSRFPHGPFALRHQLFCGVLACWLLWGLQLCMVCGEDDAHGCLPLAGRKSPARVLTWRSACGCDEQGVPSRPPWGSNLARVMRQLRCGLLPLRGLVSPPLSDSSSLLSNS